MIEYDNGLVAEIDGGYGDHVSEPHGAVELFGTGGYARILPAALGASYRAAHGG